MGRRVNELGLNALLTTVAGLQSCNRDLLQFTTASNRFGFVPMHLRLFKLSRWMWAFVLSRVEAQGLGCSGGFGENLDLNDNCK